MSLLYLFFGVFAETIDEVASCIVTVKSEVVAKVDDPAFPA